VKNIKAKRKEIESEMMLPLCLDIPIAHLLSSGEKKEEEKFRVSSAAGKSK
jgi:hypothetical protein